MFEIFLPRHRADLSRLCAAIEGQENRKSGDEHIFGYTTRFLLWLTCGNLISWQDIFHGPNSEMHIRGDELHAGRRYRLACCRRGAQVRVVIVSSTRTSGKAYSYSFKLSLSQFQALGKHLESFVHGEEFAAMMEKEVTPYFSY